MHSTDDGKAPRLELRYPHPEGDVVLIFQASFRGDVRKVLGDMGKDVEKADAELGVARQFFGVIQDAATAASNQAARDSDEILEGEVVAED